MRGAVHRPAMRGRATASGGGIHGTGSRPADWTSRRRRIGVRLPGELMQAACLRGQGAMAAILGLEDNRYTNEACNEGLRGERVRGGQLQCTRAGGSCAGPGHGGGRGAIEVDAAKGAAAARAVAIRPCRAHKFALWQAGGHDQCVFGWRATRGSNRLRGRRKRPSRGKTAYQRGSHSAPVLVQASCITAGVRGIDGAHDDCRQAPRGHILNVVWQKYLTGLNRRGSIKKNRGHQDDRRWGGFRSPWRNARATLKNLTEVFCIAERKKLGLG